jgi:hypothetical protein
MFVDTLIHLRKKKILDDVYLSDITSETISEKTKLVEKEIFFNLSSNIEVVRITPTAKMTKVIHPTRMSTKNNLLL